MMTGDATVNLAALVPGVSLSGAILDSCIGALERGVAGTFTKTGCRQRLLIRLRLRIVEYDPPIQEGPTTGNPSNPKPTAR